MIPVHRTIKKTVGIADGLALCAAWALSGPGVTARLIRPVGSGWLRVARCLLDCANRAGRPDGSSDLEADLGQFDRQDRRMVAVVITTDGRRVHVPVEPNPLADVSLLALLRSLLGLDGLLGLITGSRRENGGTRRNGR